MSKEWTVIVEGRPDCSHPSPEYVTLTVDPPIQQVRCAACDRLIQCRTEYRLVWPEVTIETTYSSYTAEGRTYSTGPNIEGAPV